MKKIAKLNDGNTIEYSNIQELEKRLYEPYNSFFPLEEVSGLLYSEQGNIVGTYTCEHSEDSSKPTNLDNILY